MWYLVTLVPVIGLVQVGSQSMADRYTYMPLIGPFAMLAFGLPDLGRSKTAGRRGFAWALGTLVIAGVAVFGVVAWRQAGYWSDSVTLFTRAIAVTKDNAVAHNGLARAYFERGQIDLAVEHCVEAVRIAPDMGAAQANLVRGLLAQRQIPEAAARTEEGLRLRPNDSRTHVNAGLVARYQGKNDEAVRHFEDALRLDANDAEAHLNLGATLAAEGRRDEAVAQLEEAVRLRPGDTRAKNALAHLLGAP
jgi:tetratricopeptide (TPR) repeat protein